MSRRASITVNNASILFPLYHSNSRSLKKTMVAAASGRVAANAGNRVVVQALRDIDLKLGSGDRLGLIGTNGAGKTTLLRMLAGIYEPVMGSVHIRGSVNALLDPNLGMNQDLSGRENIRLRGLYNNLSPAGLRMLEEDVREFAQLGDFMELPMRIYSSGMVLRLGFALATAIKPQILLMDEWFLAGDADFLVRARDRLEDMVRGAEILVLSSHQNSVVMEWCSRVLWMKDGRIHADGEPRDIIEQYLGHPLPETLVTEPDLLHRVS